MAHAQNPKVSPFIKPAEMPLPTTTADLNKPAIMRAAAGARVAAAGGWPLELDEKLINIPAFLRNQAD
jgi:cell division protein FtsZ